MSKKREKCRKKFPVIAISTVSHAIKWEKVKILSVGLFPFGLENLKESRYKIDSFTSARPNV